MVKVNRSRQGPTVLVGAFVTLFTACSWAYAVTVATVPIGNPGNSPDTRFSNVNHPAGVGSVVQSFNIGKTEVTNTQYVAFLQAVAASDPYGLYSTSMSSDTLGGIVRSGATGS
jgi:sulfatase modifying factor 1